MKTAPPRGKKAARPTADAANKEMATIFRSLGDKTRLQILRVLMREGKMNVSRLCRELGESQPAVSHHLTQLRHAKLVDFVRDGKFNHYSVSADAIKTLLREFFPHSGRVQQTLAFGDLEVSFKTR